MQSHLTFLSSVEAVHPPTGSSIGEAMVRVESARPSHFAFHDAEEIIMFLIDHGLDQHAYHWLYPFAEGNHRNPFHFVTTDVFAPWSNISFYPIIWHRTRMAAAVLIKIRLLSDVKNLRAVQESGVLDARVPPEIANKILAYIPQSGVLANPSLSRHLLQTPSECGKRKIGLERQIRHLCNAIAETRKDKGRCHYWHKLASGWDPPLLACKHQGVGDPAPESFSRLWAETPGALAFALKMSRCPDDCKNRPCLACREESGVGRSDLEDLLCLMK